MKLWADIGAVTAIALVIVGIVVLAWPIPSTSFPPATTDVRASRSCGSALAPTTAVLGEPGWGYDVRSGCIGRLDSARHSGLLLTIIGLILAVVALGLGRLARRSERRGPRAPRLHPVWFGGLASGSVSLVAALLLLAFPVNGDWGRRWSSGCGTVLRHVGAGELPPGGSGERLVLPGTSAVDPCVAAVRHRLQEVEVLGLVGATLVALALFAMGSGPTGTSPTGSEGETGPAEEHAHPEVPSA